jgi:hypothetical protein
MVSAVEPDGVGEHARRGQHPGEKKPPSTPMISALARTPSHPNTTTPIHRRWPSSSRWDPRDAAWHPLGGATPGDRVRISTAPSRRTPMRWNPRQRHVLRLPVIENERRCHWAGGAPGQAWRQRAWMTMRVRLHRTWASRDASPPVSAVIEHSHRGISVRSCIVMRTYSRSRTGAHWPGQREREEPSCQHRDRRR